MGPGAPARSFNTGRNTARTLWWPVSVWIFLSTSFDIGNCAPKPKFLGGIENVTVALGREATLECVIEDLGKNKVAWIKMDTETLLTYDRHTIVGDARLRVSHNNERQWFLHLRNVQPHDKGFYMCQINTEPMMTEVGYLDVLVPPSIVDEDTSSDTTVDENSKISLRCRADGYPKPTIMWRREDGREINLDRYGGRRNSVMTVEDEYLNMSQVSREDIGAYLCIAKNGVPPSVSQRILLQVNFRPKIRVSEQLVGAAVGTSVFLECLVEASPRPLTSWIRSDGHILLESRKYHLWEEYDSYRIRMRLQIDELQKSDYGHYRCHAKNTFGEKEGFIRLHDIPHPTTLARPTPSPEETMQKLREKQVETHNESRQSKFYSGSSVPATKPLLDENSQGFSEQGIGLPSKEEARPDDQGLTHLHFEPSGRSRSSNTNASHLTDKPSCAFTVAVIAFFVSRSQSLVTSRD